MRDCNLCLCEVCENEKNCHCIIGIRPTAATGGCPTWGWPYECHDFAFDHSETDKELLIRIILLLLVTKGPTEEISMDQLQEVKKILEGRKA